MKPFVFSLICVLFLTACDKEPETRAQAAQREWGEFVDSLKALGEQEQDKALSVAREQLQALDGKIEALQKELREKGDTMTETTREQKRTLTERLEIQAEAIEQWLDQAGSDGESFWRSVALKAERAFENGVQAVEDFFEESEQISEESQAAK